MILTLEELKAIIQRLDNDNKTTINPGIRHNEDMETLANAVPDLVDRIEELYRELNKKQERIESLEAEIERAIVRDKPLLKWIREP